MQHKAEDDTEERLSKLRANIIAILDSATSSSLLEEFQQLSNKISIVIHEESNDDTLKNYAEILNDLEEKVNLILTSELTTKEVQARKIQASIRGLLDRRKFKINKMEKLESYKTFVVGNDPIMPSLREYKEEHDQIALIATSGMRAVELAGELGNKNQIPKIILVDNSWQVHKFWELMRELMSDDTKSGEHDSFYAYLDIILKDNSNLFVNNSTSSIENMLKNRGIILPPQDIKHYFSHLFEKYGFNYVRKMIAHTSLIKQSWADPEVFSNIRNILNRIDINKVYMYPSNIVSCIEDNRVQDQVLKNIQSMNPVIAIHTDSASGFPENVIITRDQSPDKVKAMLFRSVAHLENNADDLFKAIKDKDIEALNSTINNYTNLNDINQFSIPSIVLISLNSEQELNLLENKLIKVTKDYRYPILIKIDDKYSMYGFNGSKWCLTHDLNKSIMDKITPFPSPSQKLKGNLLKESLITTEIFNEFTSKNAHINGDGLLHKALANKFNDGAKRLLEFNINANSVNKNGSTPLHVAADQIGNNDMVETLLRYGANANAVDNEGRSPLHIAASHIKSKIMCDALINANADINLKDKDGLTPLETALSSGNIEIVEHLLSRGATISDSTYELADECGNLSALKKCQSKVNESMKLEASNNNISHTRSLHK